MPANMPKDGAPGQHRPALPGAAGEMPSWVAPVKWAVAAMSVLIVLGLGLLVYGFVSGIGKLGSGSRELTLTHPPGLEPVHASPAADGQMLLLFEGDNGTREAVVIDPKRSRITARVTITPGEGGFRLGD